MCRWNKDGLQGSKLSTLGTWSVHCIAYIEYIVTIDGLDLYLQMKLINL
jgi:hypothetical protein